MRVSAELRGRSGELESLSRALDGLATGAGGVALVEGEPGIGKTRLLDELSREAEARGLLVRRGAAEELEQDRPFGPVVDALGAPDTMPLLGDRSRPGIDARFMTQDAFVDLVERLIGVGPMVLAIDDLHWADRATLATLWALARRAGDMGLLLVLAFRPAPRSRELARVIEGCQELGAQHLRLGPIDDDALGALAVDVVGAVPGPALLDALAGSRGNPFLAIEMLGALASDGGLVETENGVELESSALPAVMRDNLLRRLTGLSEATRHVLSVAAVLGGTGRLGEIAALLGISAGAAGVAVAEGARAGLLEPSGEVVAFRHELIREALYQDLPESVRAGWHREAAHQLEGHADPAVVARHLVLGSTLEDADALDRLARSAAAIVASDPDASAELLQRALELALDEGSQSEFGVARAQALLIAGRAEEAAAQANAVLTAAASPRVIAQAQMARGKASFHQGRPTDAVDGFAAARATGALDDVEAAHAMGREAASLVWVFEHDRALEQADRALAEGRRLGILGVQVEALAVRCAVHAFRAEFDAAITAGRAAVDLADEDPSALRRTPHVFLGLALLHGDQLEEASRIVELGRRHSSELGQVVVLRSYQVMLTRIAWCAGRWDDAILEADTATRLAEDFGVRFGWATTEAIKGLIQFHRGDPAGAQASFERHPRAARGRGDASGAELHVLLDALLLDAAGRREEAVDTLLQALRIDQGLEMNSARLWQGPTCVRFALSLDRAGDAREVADDLDDIARRAGTASARSAAAYARGLVERDPELLGEAIAQAAAAQRPLEQLEALEALGVLHEEGGRRDDAIARFQEAMALAEGLAATHDTRRLSSALRDLGVRSGSRSPRRQAVGGWESLTETELAVARLVGDGLRNAEIAEQLFVSRRTVEWHVSRLYSKLHAANRVALANAVREHDDSTVL